MKIKYIVQQILPPVLLKAYHHYRRPASHNAYGMMGDYRTWEEAKVNSTGYDAPFILEKTRQATLKVIRGEAKYERDSVLLDEIEVTWPVVAGLMWIAAQYRGELNVLDFGGSLGSTYYQNRQFLTKIPNVRWNIVEQSGHVDVGKQYIEDETVKFYHTIDECLAKTRPHVLFLGGLLQYLEKPFEVIRLIQSSSIQFLLLDRTPVWEGLTDKICIQKVPPEIYPASYPSWIFSQSRFRNTIKDMGFRILAEFVNVDWMPAPVPFNYKGMLAVRTATQG